MAADAWAGWGWVSSSAALSGGTLGLALLAGFSFAAVGTWPTAALLKALSNDLLPMVQADRQVPQTGFEEVGLPDS